MNKPNNTKLKKQIVSHLDDLLSALLEEVEQIKFNKENPQELYLMCFYARILDLSFSINTLLKSDDCTGLPILLRSQMEAFVDFINLRKDEDFLYKIAASFVDQKSRLNKNSEKNLGWSNKESLNEKQIQDALQGHKPQAIWKRFKQIGLDKTYATVYFILCNYSHNNLAMIEHKHLDKKNEQHRFVLHKNEPLSDFIRFTMTFGAILVDAHNNLIDFFKTSPSNRTKDLCSQFSRLRTETKDLIVEDI